MGVHPYRQWCHTSAHPDAGKCPVHVAAESNQLVILKLFITKSLLTLACRDPGGRDLLKIAIQHGHRDCVRYLANKLCSVVSLPNISLPMRIYLQMKHWVNLGQKRAVSNRCQHISASFKTRMGDMLLVDGFNRPQMSSKSRKAEPKLRRVIRAKALQHLPPISNILSLTHLPSKSAPPQLPSLQSMNPGDFKETQQRWKQDVKQGDDDPLDKIKEGDSILCGGKFTLPPVSREGISKPGFVCSSPKSSSILTASLESVSQHCGRTQRENAIYYLSIARSLYFLLCKFMCMCTVTHCR